MGLDFAVRTHHHGLRDTCQIQAIPPTRVLTNPSNRSRAFWRCARWTTNLLLKHPLTRLPSHISGRLVAHQFLNNTFSKACNGTERTTSHTHHLSSQPCCGKFSIGVIQRSSPMLAPSARSLSLVHVDVEVEPLRRRSSTVHEFCPPRPRLIRSNHAIRSSFNDNRWTGQAVHVACGNERQGQRSSSSDLHHTSCLNAQTLHQPGDTKRSLQDRLSEELESHSASIAPSALDPKLILQLLTEASIKSPHNVCAGTVKNCWSAESDMARDAERRAAAPCLSVTLPPTAPVTIN